MAAPDVLLSVVVPVFNEEGGLVELHRRPTDALGAIDGRAEIVYIDDGSTDGSVDLIKGSVQRPGSPPEAGRPVEERDGAPVVK